MTQAPISPTQIPLPQTGALRPRRARDIAGSNWAVGGETMDRDYTVYKNWRPYLGPLGAKMVRLQAGWAKCERTRGVYRFDWLDAIIDDVINQGVVPWLQTSYGNPIYPGGGELHLGGGMPTSDKALAAWDRWVAALAHHFRDRVKVWEVWNEPDLNVGNDAEAYARLYIRTAEAIRAEVPGARLFALSLAHVKEVSYVESFLKLLQEEGKLDLVDEITVHGYTHRPEDILPAYDDLRSLLHRYNAQRAHPLVLRQGELGCPSENQHYLALSNYPWTETSQAKWLLRRLLSDLGRAMPSLYFAMMDMVYGHIHGHDITTINRKGLLRANDDKTVAYAKPAYRAFQSLTRLFDDTWVRIPDVVVTHDPALSLAVYAYQHRETGARRAVLWFDNAVPGDGNATTPVEVTFEGLAFQAPSYVDLRTGAVYEIPPDRIAPRGRGTTFYALPLYDSPVMVGHIGAEDYVHTDKKVRTSNSGSGS